MTLNDEQFKHKCKEDNVKCIFFFEGHASLDHDVVRPFKRIGGGQNENLSNEELLEQLAEFSKLYSDIYSVYIHSSSASITTKGFFCKIDLRVKAKVEETSTHTQPAVNIDTLKKEIRDQIEKEHKIEELSGALAHQVEINQKNDLVANKLANVGLQMLKQFGMDMQGAPMQGDPAEQQTTETMDIEQALKYVNEKLGDEFIIHLAEKFKADPSLAGRLKSML